MHLIGGGIAHLVFKFFDYSTRGAFLGTKGLSEYSFGLNGLLRQSNGMKNLHGLIKRCAPKIPSRSRALSEQNSPFTVLLIGKISCYLLYQTSC